MSQIKVFSDKELLEAVTAKGKDVIVIEKKKEDKVYKFTRFLNLYFNIDGTKREGWFTIENVLLTVGVADPSNVEDKRNEFHGTRHVLQTSVSNAGAFGKALLALNDIWTQHVQSYVVGNRKLHELLQTATSDTNEKNPGVKIDDPIIRIKIDFGLYPKNYKYEFLRSKPRTIFYDARTMYIDEHGRKQYQLAKVDVDGVEQLVNSDNMHKFITTGSKIISARITMPSVAVSRDWVSCPYIANRVVLEPGNGGGFSDELLDDSAAQINELKAVLAVPPPQEPAAAVTEIDKDIEDLLENI